LRGSNWQDRIRRYRERVRRGRMCVTVELGVEHLNSRVRSEWLANRDVHTKREIVAALQALIDDIVCR
jgi:hypothetical protein